MGSVLAGATAALHKAQDFDDSVAKQAGTTPPKPVTHPEYKYSQASAANKSSLSDEAKSAAEGIAAKNKNIDEYKKAFGDD